MYRLNLDPLAGISRLDGLDGHGSDDEGRLDLLKTPNIPTEDNPEGLDPRGRPSPSTKASLKQFEFVPRGDLSDFHIPKKVASREDASSTAADLAGRSDDPSNRPSVLTSSQPRMSLAVPNWTQASSSSHMPGPGPSSHDYWSASWSPEAAAYWGPPAPYGYGYYGEEWPAEEETEFGASYDAGPTGQTPSNPTPSSMVTADMILGDGDTSATEAELLKEPEWDLTALDAHLAAFGSDTGPALHPTLNSHVNNLWKKGTGNKIKDIHEKYPRPSGCQLFRTSLNDSIRCFMQEKAKFPLVRDVKLTGIQGLIARAAVPLARGCESAMRKDKPITPQACLDFQLDSLTLLASANQQINQLRKDLIKPIMNNQLRASVCRVVKDEDPSEELFADLEGATKMAKQTSGLMGNPYPRGRGRGRGRFHPYFGPPGGFGGRGYGPPRGAFFPPRGEYVDFVSISDLQSLPVLDCTDAMSWNSNLESQSDECSMPVDINVNSSARVCSRWQTQLSKRPRPTTGQTVIETPQKLPPSRLQVSYKDAPPLTNKWDHFRACRAKLCLASWRKHTSDPWLLKNLHGYKLEFTQLPQQTFENHEIKFSTTESAFLAQEIETLLTKGVIVQSQDEADQFVSNVFLRPKKEAGKFRMIFDLIKLNEFVEYQLLKWRLSKLLLKW
jgi:hypothetical protein